MSLLAAMLTLILLVAVMAVVGRPLLTAHASKDSDVHDELGTLERAELEVAREAKYREIRDTELDYRTGKLSNDDYQSVNGALRAEAVEILDRLDSLVGGTAEEHRETAEERQEPVSRSIRAAGEENDR